MEKRFLIDTNILIYYLDGKLPKNQLETINNIFEFSFNISTITKIEVLGWNKITDEIKTKLINSYTMPIFTTLTKLLKKKL